MEKENTTDNNSLQKEKKSIIGNFGEICVYKKILSYVYPKYDIYKNIVLTCTTFKYMMEDIMIEYIHNTIKFFPIQRKNINISPIYEFFIFQKRKKKFLSIEDEFENSRVDTLIFDKVDDEITHRIFQNNGKHWISENFYIDNYSSKMNTIIENKDFGLSIREFNSYDKSLSNISENLSSFQLINKLIFEFDAFLSGSYVLYYIMGCPNNWIYNNINIYINSDYFGCLNDILQEFEKEKLVFNIEYDCTPFVQTNLWSNVINDGTIINGVHFIYNNTKIHITFIRKRSKNKFIIDDLMNWFNIDVCKCIYDGRDIRLNHNFTNIFGGTRIWIFGNFCQFSKIKKSTHDLINDIKNHKIKEPNNISKDVLEKYKKRGFSFLYYKSKITAWEKWDKNLNDVG